MIVLLVIVAILSVFASMFITISFNAKLLEDKWKEIYKKDLND